jgi:glycosyltransferase involved in cell wall biosynthesis
MQKLLILTRWYLPATKSGGTVRSIRPLVKGLKDDFDITILTSNKDLGSDKPYEGVVFDHLTTYDDTKIIYLSVLNIKNIYKQIKSVNPDIIYVNSFFDITTQIVLLLNYFKRLNVKIILSPRGELGEGALSIKSHKKNIYLTLHKLLNLSKGIVYHATGNEDVKDIRKIFSKNEIQNLTNLSEDIEINFPLPVKEVDKLKMVFISRIAPKKNLDYALEILEKYTFNGFIEFDIYGPDEDFEYWQKCQKIIAKMPNNIKVNYKGFVNPSLIKKTLSNYHLFFFPTKGENFGHAIVESMQVGLIPLISDKTPWLELEQLHVGFSLSLGNTDAFGNAIKEMLLLSNEDFLQYSKNTKTYIEKKIDNRKNIEEYKILLSN